MAELEDTNFDVIILGTGVAESMLAAASARVGQKVLHMDKNAFYGGSSATLSVSALCEFLGKEEPCKVPPQPSVQSTTQTESSLSEVSEEKPVESAPISPESQKESSSHDPEPATTQTSTVTPQQAPSSSTPSLSPKELHKYNIDVMPKLLFSRGAMVEALVQSNVARYVEFKSLSRSYLYLQDGFQKVPSTKGEIFSHTFISNMEKHYLISFLRTIFPEIASQSSGAPAAPTATIDQSVTDAKSFIAYLTEAKLSPKLQSFILYALALIPHVQSQDSDKSGWLINATEGLNRVKAYLGSIGRFSNQPFIYPLYGISEINQAFCRQCAVFAGIYILRRKVDEVQLDSEGKYASVVSEGQTLTSKLLITAPDELPAKAPIPVGTRKKVSRCVCIVDSSIKPAETDADSEIVLVVVPPSPKNLHPVHVLQLDPSLYVCPDGRYLVHFTTPCTTSAEADLKAVVETILPSGGKINVLWSTYFEVEDGGAANFGDNVQTCEQLNAALDLDQAVLHARKVFEKMFPGLPFLPTTPNPEDIIWGGEDDQSTKEQDKQETLQETPQETPQEPTQN